MNHSGKALRAGLKLVFKSFVALIVVIALGYLAKLIGPHFALLARILIALWVVFVGFIFYFFRDPDPLKPHEPNLIVSPAHGTVDVIDETIENEFMGGACQRVSMFLSPINVHVQNAPVSAKIACVKQTPGKFVSAVKASGTMHNENVLIGFEPVDRPAEKIAIRLIAGVLARRIIPWVAVGDVVPRSERISLIQFGSRCDLYLPKTAKIKIKLGTKLIGGQSIIAAF
ncbi:MAG: phosphatidylserine decarboxylase family protein [Verrucomicrobia bacterium]|nr:MAG: phosphatidylserine decarboxylase family protein [Verrucomicrobiota bacterium]